MKEKKGLVILLCCLPFIVSSCVSSIGVRFKPNTGALQIGRLKSSEYVEIFGKPSAKFSKINSDGRYDLTRYDFAENSVGTVSSRALLLEFKNNVLNGFEFVSSFNEDKTTVDTHNVDQVRKGIGKLSDQEVVAILGQPNGKAISPTTLADFKDKIGKGAEIWGWFTREKVHYNFSNHTDSKSAFVYVIFDSNRQVLDVQAEENDTRSFIR